MKRAKDEPVINTIPEGAYESGVTNQGIRQDLGAVPADPGIDAQGNGYPTDPGRHKN